MRLPSEYKDYGWIPASIIDIIKWRKSLQDKPFNELTPKDSVIRKCYEATVVERYRRMKGQETGS